MLRHILATAAFVLLPEFCAASTYHCVLKQKGPGDAKPKSLWAGKIVLKDEEAADAQVFVVQKNGAAISFGEITKDAADSDAVRAAVKPYDGLPVMGLRQNGLALDVNLGHVDSANPKDLAPMDADAVSSVDTKEIGVSDARIGLSVMCRLE
jgi:hypothetical protein